MSMEDLFKSRERICPICKKLFLLPPQSIYRLHKKGKIVDYCSYTCWRKAGGDRK